MSAIPVADRCIKSSKQPCNLHRQTLAVEWHYWRAQWHSTWHRNGCHLSNKSVCQISALLELSGSTVSAVIVKWKRLWATSSQCGTTECWSTQSDNNRLSLPSSKLPLEATSAQELFVGSFVKRVSTAEQPHTSLRSPCAIPRVGWSFVPRHFWTLVQPVLDLYEFWLILKHVVPLKLTCNPVKLFVYYQS
jgi:hypothetical protein